MAKLVNGANNYKQAEPTIKLNGNTNLTLSSDGKYYVSSNLGITTTGNVKDSYTVEEKETEDNEDNDDNFESFEMDDLQEDLELDDFNDEH